MKITFLYRPPKEAHEQRLEVDWPLGMPPRTGEIVYLTDPSGEELNGEVKRVSYHYEWKNLSVRSMKIIVRLI